MALISKEKFLKKTEKLPQQKVEAGSGLMSRDDFVSFAQAAQKKRQEQQQTQYEAAYESYKKAMDTLAHDQQSGYRRTQQERQKQLLGSINHDQMSGYRRTQQEQSRQQQRKTQTGTAAQRASSGLGQDYSRLIGLNQFDGELERRAAEWQQKEQQRQSALTMDQVRGQQRTAYELGKQIEQLETELNDNRFRQMRMDEGGSLYYLDENGRRVAARSTEELNAEIAKLQTRKSKLDKSLTGRVGEYAGDLVTGIVSGGADMALGGIASVLDYLEQGANGAAAWALRDLAKAVPDGGLKNKMLSLANDFESYWTGESTTEHEKTAQYYSEELQKLNAELENNYKGPALWAQQQMPSMGNMLFGAGVSGVTGVNNLVTLGVTAGGNAAQEAKSKGATDVQALAYGVVAGGLEAFSERLFGGNPIYDKDAGLVNKAVGKLTDNKTILRILNSKAFDIASEGLEEVVTEVLDPVAEWAIYNGSNTEFADAESIGNAFLGGVFLSVVGNIADAPAHLRQARYERVMNAAAVELADIAQNVDSADVQEAAQVIRDKIAYGVTPDAADIGAVLDAMSKEGEAVDTQTVQAAVERSEAQAEAEKQETVFQQYNAVMDAQDAAQRDAERIARARSEETTEAISESEAESAQFTSDTLMEQEAKDAQTARGRLAAEEARTDAAFDQETRQTEMEALQDAARQYGFDDRMTSVLLSGYDGAQDAQQYAEKVNAAYEYGRNGMSLTAAQRAAQDVNADVVQEAWNAGKDAIQRTPMSAFELYNRYADERDARQAAREAPQQAPVQAAQAVTQEAQEAVQAVQEPVQQAAQEQTKPTQERAEAAAAKQEARETGKRAVTVAQNVAGRLAKEEVKKAGVEVPKEVGDYAERLGEVVAEHERLTGTDGNRSRTEGQISHMVTSFRYGTKGITLISSEKNSADFLADTQAWMIGNAVRKGSYERLDAAKAFDGLGLEERTLRYAAAAWGYSDSLAQRMVREYNAQDGASAAEYAQHVRDVFDRGAMGESFASAKDSLLGESMSRAAWNAGKGFINGEEAGSTAADDGGKRDAGMDTGKPSGAVAGRTGGTAEKHAGAARAKERTELENRVRAAGAQYLSGKDIGLAKGSERRSFREAPESTWTDEMKNAAQTLHSAGFSDVHFTVGAISIENQKAKVTRYADGAAIGDTVWINATATKWTVTQLANHEAFHRQVQDAPYLLESVRSALAEELGADGVAELARRYAEAYEGCYGAEDIDAYVEEICADAYAGMDRLPEAKTEILQKAARQAQDAQRTAEKYSYAGEVARTADRQSLTRAEQMEERGASAGNIFRETGWFKGADGQWRFEIDDSKMEFRRDGDARLMEEAPYRRMQELSDKWAASFEKGGEELTEAESTELEALQDQYVDRVWEEKYELQDFLKHDELYRAYPKLRHLSLIFRPMSIEESGYYSAKEGAIVLNSDMIGVPENTLIHEIQHVIQRMEGFARGASPKYWNDRMKDGFSKKNAAGEEMLPNELYKNTAGEIEARDAAARRKLSAEERRNRMPDTGNADTVFAEGDGYFSMSVEEQEGILEQIRKNQNALGKMEPVGKVNTSEFADLDTKDARAKIVRALKNTGYAVDRPGFGRIQFGESEINNSLNYKQKNPAAEDARRTGFLLLKDVLKRGIEISGHDNHKGRNYETITIAAPVEINGERGNMAVVIKMTKGNRYKVHRILTPGGDTFTLPNMANAEMNTVGAFTNDSQSLGGSTPAINSASGSSIRSSERKSQEKFSAAEDARIAAEEAAKEPAAVYESLTMDSMPKKAQDYLKRVQGRTAAAIQQTLSMPFAARQEVLKPALGQMMNEYLQTGRITQETIDKTFEDSYAKGVELDTEFYDQYKDVKTRLRDLKVTLSEADRADIADYDDFRRAAFGRLRIANEGGLPVDTAYMQMREMAPELFPASITYPADQLMKMFEVSKSIQKVERSLDEAHGENAEEFKRWAKNDYEASVEGMLGSLRTARRYAEARMRQKQARAVPTTQEEVTALWQELKKLRRTYERASAKNLMTAEDNAVLNRLLRGEITPEDVQGMENADGILAMYEAKADYDVAAAKIADWKRYRKSRLLEEADGLLQNADQAKDKPAGILYARETMTRNVRDIFPEADAEAINRTYFEPIRRANADANKMKNRLREQVAELDLSRKAKKGDAVSEAHAVQLLGEAQDNIRYLEKNPRVQDRDGKTLDEWRGIVQELWKTSPGLDKAKIESAVESFRKIYDGLFEQMNEVRIRNGYEPINYRQGYFPHFQPGTSDGILSLMGKALGIDAEVTALPTTINGLTHTFKPGITYFGHALERIGFDTAYDAVEGFDKYVEGAASVIHYTDAIQKLRALAQQVRYRTSDEGLRERVDAVRALENVSEQDKENRIKEIMEKGRYSLSNFAAELDEYTNLLANKKSKYDRGVEHLSGRWFYKVMKAWQSRVAANMVAVNPASWLTNFGVITQAGAQLKTTSVLKAMAQTLKSWKTDDGFVDRSDFLTNRRGSDPLIRSLQQNVSATLSKPMDWIDTFSADTIVRARYMENVERGMSAEDAVHEADDFAANVMAERAKGAMPTLFESRNPITKMFTQFQLEVNNTFSYLFKDLPQEQRKKGVGALALALFKFLIGGYLYNEVYEHFIGRRPMLDPLGILNDTVGDLTGYELNNLLDAATGDGLIKESEQESVIRSVANLAVNVGQELPVIGSRIGGGKYPFMNSFGDIGNAIDALDAENKTGGQKAVQAAQELINPAAYWLLPFGGGQVKKMWQGIQALKNQGSYTADGRLQYPIYSDRKGDKAGALARTLLFGKSATPEAQAWVEAGFGALSEKATATYEAMRDAGVDQRDSYELIKAMSKVKKTDDATAKQLKMQVLRAFDIEDSGKVLYYYGMMANEKEQAEIDRLLAEGADMGEYLRFLDQAAGVTGEKDEDGKTISGSKKQETMELIDGLELTPEQKTELAESRGYKTTGFESWTENHDKLYNAVSSGKDLKKTLQSLKKDGYEDEDLRAAITDLFKEEYLAADRAGRARLKGYLRNAFMECGLSKKQAENKIDKWTEAKK